MKKNYPILILVLIPIFFGQLVFSQTEEEPTSSSIDLGVDLVSRYIWRGLQYCATPSIQPYLSYTSKDENLSFGAWGSYSNFANYGEVDLFVSYTYKYATLAVWDYFLMDETAARNKYFLYDNKTTGHSYEASLVLSNFKIPIQITSSIFFYGADKDPNGDNFYSLYFEAAYPLTIANQEINFFMGGTPAEGLYGTGAGIVNIGCSTSKDIKISDKYSLPLNGSFIINPREENIYFVIGLSF